MSSPNTSAGRRSLSLTNVTSVFSILAAAAGLWALLYGLGLLLMAGQFWLTFGHDFATAWYASTLVSRSVVVGETLQTIAARPGLLLYVGIFGLAAYLFRRFQPVPVTKEDVKKVTEEADTWRQLAYQSLDDSADRIQELRNFLSERRRTFDAAMPSDTEPEASHRLAESVALSRDKMLADEHRVEELARELEEHRADMDAQLELQRKRERRHQTTSRVTRLAGIAIQVILIYIAAHSYIVEGDWYGAAAVVLTLLIVLCAANTAYNHAHVRPLAVTILEVAALLYVGFTVAGWIGGWLHSPPLPTVEISGKHAKLLSHADGYWHVVMLDGQVRSVSDDKRQKCGGSSQYLLRHLQSGSSRCQALSRRLRNLRLLSGSMRQLLNGRSSAITLVVTRLNLRHSAGQEDHRLAEDRRNRDIDRLRDTYALFAKSGWYLMIGRYIALREIGGKQPSDAAEAENRFKDDLDTTYSTLQQIAPMSVSTVADEYYEAVTAFTKKYEYSRPPSVDITESKEAVEAAHGSFDSAARQSFQSPTNVPGRQDEGTPSG